MATDNELLKLPPGRDALTQHTKRACYQAGYLWRKAIGDFQLPDPKLWEWEGEGDGNYYTIVGDITIKSSSLSAVYQYMFLWSTEMQELEVHKSFY